jgi:hypothetical protein
VRYVSTFCPQPKAPRILDKLFRFRTP